MNTKVGKFVVGLILLLIAVAVLTVIVSASVYAVTWSITNIQMSGVNFWSVWWLMWVGFLYIYALGLAIRNT